MIPLILLAVPVNVRGDSEREAVRLRQPVAIARLGERLFVANRRSGTVSVLNGEDGRVEREFAVGRRPVDLIAVESRNELLVCDETAHELIVVHEKAGEWAVADRIAVAKYPRAVSVRGRMAAVSSSWSRRLTLVDLDRASARPATVDLPFLGGRVTSTPAGFVVAAAGEGRLAVVSVDPPRIERTIDLQGHNVGGLFFNAERKELLVTQQVLKDDTSTTYEHVFWGVVLKNVLETIPLARLEQAPERDDSVEQPPRDFEFLGFPSDAAGDPADVVVTERGQTLVAIGGVDTLHARTGPNEAFVAFTAERRPSGIAISANGRMAFVCNTYADSITLIDLEKFEQAGRVSLGPSPEPTLVDRGASLFHDARLSLDGWYSCHSCHTNGHSSGRRTDNLGDGEFGDPKRIPSLLGSHGTGPWAWNGSSKTLDGQVRKSILKTMRGGAATDEDVQALVAYLGTLEPPPSLAEARDEVESKAAERGRAVFENRGCVECHSGKRLTSDTVYDVGLTDAHGGTEFNPPSLRGVSQRSTFLHDGRVKSLRDVLERVRHPNDNKLSRPEIDDLLEYLRGL